LRRLIIFSGEINMADPMRIRAQANAGKTVVRVLMQHEMETGQRRDPAGKVIPAWHITQVSVALNGKVVMSADWGPSISKDPFMQFSIKGGKAGDKVAVTWTDTRGDKRTDEVSVS
jgi:sulfur-oxidizing protein SoxZ